MNFHTIYAEQKIRQMKTERVGHQQRRTIQAPDVEIPRTGAGRVHEVFRRIAEGEAPARQPSGRRWLLAR